MKSLHVVLTGASGYLGQHLLNDWIQNDGIVPAVQPNNIDFDDIQITALYHKLEGFKDCVKKFQDKLSEEPSPSKPKVDVSVKSIDLTDPIAMKLLGESLEKEEKEKNAFIVIVHTAAMSSPRLCEQYPHRAKVVNIPIHFFDAIQNYPMIALSTDQVYNGKQNLQLQQDQEDNDQQTDSIQYYKEYNLEAIQPVNVYGQTKLEMENYLVKQRTKSSTKIPLYLLRSSIIVGPRGPFGGAHDTFIDFCYMQGKTRQCTTFFTNEFRTIVCVSQVINVINDCIIQSINRIREDTDDNANGDNTNIPKIYNMGGPIRVNRYDIAKAVFEYFDFDQTLLQKAEQSSPSSPLDISMDSTLLLQTWGLGGQHHPTTMKGVVEYVFNSDSKNY